MLEQNMEKTMTKTALVTGGTRGIGKAISIALKEEGFSVIANYAGNDKAAEDFTNETGIPTCKFDVADFEACEKSVNEIVEKYGDIAILVNNAGVTRDSALHRMTLEDWNTVIDINLSSCFNMCKATIPKMRENNYGRIVNISSVNGQIGQKGQTNYSATKAGVVGFSKALARENARKGITVNCVAPGYIDTEMVSAVNKDVLAGIVESVPVGRLGEPSEIARAVTFLTDSNAGFITGETLSVNGGLEME